LIITSELVKTILTCVIHLYITCVYIISQ